MSEFYTQGKLILINSWLSKSKSEYFKLKQSREQSESNIEMIECKMFKYPLRSDF